MLYNETATTIYRRSNNVTFNNELGQLPQVTFHEQYATVDGVAIDGRAGSCALEMPADVTEEFPLVHPLTGESLGTTSYANLHVILHSLYLHAATTRDSAELTEGGTRVLLDKED